jgi:hypothetical protein
VRLMTLEISTGRYRLMAEREVMGFFDEVTAR